MTEIPQNFPCTYKPDNARTITISMLNLVRFSPGAAFIPANKGNRLINFYLIINKSNKCLIPFSPGRNLENRGHRTCICIQCMYVSDDIVFLRFVCLKKIIMSSVVVFDTNRWRV